MSLNANYPLYSAAAVSSDAVLVTGGGGEGNNGIPNKVSLVNIKRSATAGSKSVELNLAKEYEIKGKNDSPTGIVVAKDEDGTGIDRVLVSCNGDGEAIKSGKNMHLRKFQLKRDGEDLLERDSAADIMKSTDSLDYIKISKLSVDGKTLALVTSSIPSKIFLVDTKTLEETSRIEFTGKEEVSDVAFSKENFSYILNRKIVTYIKPTFRGEDLGAKHVIPYKTFSPSYTLSKVEFLNEETLILAVTLANKRGVLLLEQRIEQNTFDPLLNVKGEEILPEKPRPELRLRTSKARVVSSKPMKATALVVSKDTIAVATNTNDIIISSPLTFKAYRVLSTKDHGHSFAITSLVIPPKNKVEDEDIVVSVSVSQIVSAWVVPRNLVDEFDIWDYSGFIMAILAIAVFFFGNIYVQKNYKNEVNSIMQVLFGEDLIGDVSDPAIAIAEDDKHFDAISATTTTVFTETTVKSSQFSEDTVVAGFEDLEDVTVEYEMVGVTGAVEVGREHVVKQGDIVEEATTTRTSSD